MSKETYEHEVAILKGTSVKLSDDVIFIIAYVYHSDSDDVTKSFYRYVGRVVNIKDLENEIKDMHSDERRLTNWEFDTPVMKGWSVGTANCFNCDKGSKWYQLRIKKALAWADYVRLVEEGTRYVASTKRYVTNPKSAYICFDYVADTGEEGISILNSDKLLSLVGHYITKDVPLKYSYGVYEPLKLKKML